MSLTEPRARFARRLAALRKERGYQSAYGFFHKNGGEDGFGFSYKSYLRIERGERLPSKDSLKRILEKLGIGMGHILERRKVLETYLMALVDGDSIFDVVFDRPKSAGAETELPAQEILIQKTARRLVSQVPSMSEGQGRTVAESPATVATFYLLLQSGQTLTRDELSVRIGLKESEVGKALNSLESAGLVEKDMKGAYRCPSFRTDLFFPASTLDTWGVTSIMDSLSRYAPSHERHKSFQACLFLALEQESEIGLLTGLFRDAYRKSYLLRSGDTVRSGSLISVETRISRMCPLGAPD